MGHYKDLIEVADITALKAFAASDGDIKKVTEIDATYPYPASYYCFQLGATYTENAPGIVADDLATGFWVMIGQPLVLNSGDPSGDADFPGILWVNTTSNARYISNAASPSQWDTIGSGSAGSATTTTTTGYTQPAVNSNVTINVGDSSIFAVGQFVFVETGGNYEVISKPGPTQLEIENTGATGNAAPATTISTGSLVAPSGPPGIGGGLQANLAYTAAAGEGTVTSDVGTDATIPAATATNAGLFLPAEKTKLTGIETNATADQTGAEIEALLDTQLGGTSWKTSTGDATSIQGTNVDSSVGTPSDGDILVYRSAGADFILESKPASGSNPAAADITDATADGIALITSTDANPFTDADETKLDGIATSATANSTDAVLLDRANHTGTQAASTIGSGTFADARISSSSVTQHESSLTITESQISDLGTYRTDLVNTNRILGRISSGTGVIENLTAAQARTLLNVENGATAGVANPVDIFYQSVDALTYSDGGTTTMDNGAFNAFSLTANGTSTTIAHSNVPTTGNEYYFRLHLTWTAGAITWPSSWTKGMNAPTATGDYIIHGVTIDGGTSFAITLEYL